MTRLPQQSSWERTVRITELDVAVVECVGPSAWA